MSSKVVNSLVKSVLSQPSVDIVNALTRTNRSNTREREATRRKRLSEAARTSRHANSERTKRHHERVRLADRQDARCHTERMAAVQAFCLASSQNHEQKMGALEIIRGALEQDKLTPDLLLALAEPPQAPSVLPILLQHKKTKGARDA